MSALFLAVGQHEASAASCYSPTTNTALHPILVGQQNAAQRLHLHGIIRGVDLNSRRVRLVHLAPLEMFWEEALPRLEIDSSVNLTTLKAGTPVVAIVARRADGQYYIVALQANEQSNRAAYAPDAGKPGSGLTKPTAA
jgi:Cu/Ag efflux protein CusF